MFEDSMKNIRSCKGLGMGTVLLTGTGGGGGGYHGKGDDVPQESDPAVDVAMGTCGELKAKIPQLWQKRF